MVKNHTFLLFILSYIFIFINSANPSEKHKAHHVKQDNKFKKNIRKKFSKRKIQDKVVKMKHFHLFHYPYI